MLLDDVEKDCKNIFEWGESISETDPQPVCTDECKSSIRKFQNFKDDHHCCACGNITDDHKVEDVRYAIQCNQKRRNTMRWCFNDTMKQPMMCEECRQEGNKTYSYTCLCLSYCKFLFSI